MDRKGLPPAERGVDPFDIDGPRKIPLSEDERHAMRVLSFLVRRGLLLSARPGSNDEEPPTRQEVFP